MERRKSETGEPSKTRERRKIAVMPFFYFSHVELSSFGYLDFLLLNVTTIKMLREIFCNLIGISECDKG